MEIKKIFFIVAFLFLPLSVNAMSINIYGDFYCRSVMSDAYEDQRLYYNGGVQSCDGVNAVAGFGTDRYNQLHNSSDNCTFYLFDYDASVRTQTATLCAPSSKPQNILFVTCCNPDTSIAGNDPQANYGRSSVTTFDVTGVVIGGEHIAAAAACHDYFASIQTPTPETGYVRTDQQQSVGYTSELNGDGTTTTVHVSCIVNSNATVTNGTVVPIGDLPNSGTGTGGTGGLTVDQTTAAVAAGVTAGNAGVITGQTAIKNNLDNVTTLQATTNSLLSDIKTGQTTNIALDLQNTLLSNVNTTLNNTSGMPSPPTEAANYGSGPNGAADDMTQGMTDTDNTRNGSSILGAFKTSGLVTSINGLFDADQTKIVLADDVCSFQAPAPFGHSSSMITFSLCTYADTFAAMGNALFAFAGIGIVFFIFE